LRTLILRHSPDLLLLRLREKDPTELELEIQNSRFRMQLAGHMPGLWCHVRVDATHNFRSRIRDPGSKYLSRSLSTNHSISPESTSSRRICTTRHGNVSCTPSSLMQTNLFLNGNCARHHSHSHPGVQFVEHMVASQPRLELPMLALSIHG
jgi:hypothetical protein